MEVAATTGLLELSRAKLQSNHHHRQSDSDDDNVYDHAYGSCQCALCVRVCVVQGRSERPHSGSAADVLVHRVARVVPRRGELLRSAGLQLLHADQDRVAAVAFRGRRLRRLFHGDARPAMSRRRL